jgi:aspartyl-tRNA(Asn)/glutamyl-tRNA(Gln) amidotransferase subunit B
MKVLVTGHKGYLGAEFLGRYSDIFDIVGYDLKEGDDILDYDRLVDVMNGCDMVIHLAAIPKPIEGKSFEDYFQTNCVGTKNVLRAALANKVRRFIYASSTTVYGIERGIPFITPVTENIPVLSQYIHADELRCRDIDMSYHTSKVIAEQMLAWYGLNKKLQIVSLRFGPINKVFLDTSVSIENATHALERSLLSEKEFWFEVFSIVDEIEHISRKNRLFSHPNSQELSLQGLYFNNIFMATYFPTIGLEIHAELKTHRKMFCGSANHVSDEGVDSQPNQHICPVCMAHPGTLPVINKDAVKKVLQVGLAINANLADYTEFDRKSYFYPDLPKGYQLSQLAYPLVSGGELNGVAVTRIHLEEDTARSQHDPKTGTTLIDYNRAGVPLMELVTEPVIHSSKQAGDFGRELQILLKTLGVSNADMEKGQMRVEVNLSISPDEKVLGTKVEVKNINSFKAAEKAIEFEIKRQTELLDSGGVIKQETRGWDENGQKTFSQRVKEGSADYRYFPDPDLPKMKLSEVPEFAHDSLRKDMPELPADVRARYAAYGIKEEETNTYLLDDALHAYFKKVIAGFDGDTAKIKLAHNYTSSDVAKIRTEMPEILDRPELLAEIVTMISEGQISSRGAKDILGFALAADFNRQNAGEIAKIKNLLQESDEAVLSEVAKKVVEANPQAVIDYKAGKVQLLQFLVGNCMKELKGSGNPILLQKILTELLK